MKDNLNSWDRQRIARALDALRVGAYLACLTTEDDGGFGFYNMRKLTTKKWVMGWIERSPGRLIGFYKVTAEVPMQEMRGMILDDLRAAGVV